MTHAPDLPTAGLGQDPLASLPSPAVAALALKDNDQNDDSDNPGQPNPTSAESGRSEFTGGSRGNLSGRNNDQNRAAGIDDPIAEGSRQGRERYKSDIASSTDNDGQHSV